jgi:tripeptide aminopeptidase
MRDDALTARVLGTFLDLVRIDSASGEEGRLAGFLADELAALGLRVDFDATAETTGSDTGNLIAELEGTVPAATLVLSAHMDTVEPGRGVEPSVVDGVVRSAGDTVLGADDKAGIAAILETLRRLGESDAPHGPVRVVLTVQEERGLVGAKALAPELLEGDLCLVLDADGPAGGIVTASPTHYTFAATFTGRSAHAGVEPEKGVSAVAMAAHAVDAMQLGRLDERTTANIGRIEGGVATNVVAPVATLTGECRSRDAGRVEEVRLSMDAVMRSAADDAGGSVDIAWTREYSGYRFGEDDMGFRLVRDACLEAGLTPRPYETGGGSDANILAEKGLPSIVLSCGMTSVHSTSESVAVADLESLVRLLLAVIGGAVRQRGAVGTSET